MERRKYGRDIKKGMMERRKYGREI